MITTPVSVIVPPATMRGVSSSPSSVTPNSTPKSGDRMVSGETLVIGTDIQKWTTYSKGLPDYELRISFTTDECSGKNNIVKLLGSDINAVLSGT